MFVSISPISLNGCVSTSPDELSVTSHAVNALSLGMVLSDLSRRFNAALLLTILLAAAYLIVLIIASRENVVSTGVAMLIALFIIWFFQPPFLSYKAWKIKKKYR
ncbi:TPA: hypothetical protein SCR59_003609 [Enterobacter cloacae]|nr:hypothetical protein [Enterobacter cloacae]